MMMIDSINHVLKWVSVYVDGKLYTRDIKEINGELFFKFKNEWYKMADCISEYTTEFKEK